jgi:hypothetical protein
VQCKDWSSIDKVDESTVDIMNHNEMAVMIRAYVGSQLQPFNLIIDTGSFVSKTGFY